MVRAAKIHLLRNLLFAVENTAMLVEGITMVLFGLFFIAIGVWQLRYVDRTDQEMIEVKNGLGGHDVTRERATKGAVILLIFGVIALVLGIVTLLTQRLFGIFPY